MMVDDAEPGTPASGDAETAPTSPLLTAIPEDEQNGMNKPQAYSLYTSHFLSTWNVRTYEFAAVSEVQRVNREAADERLPDYFHICGISSYTHGCCYPVSRHICLS